MRKRIIAPVPKESALPDLDWLNVAELAEAVTMLEWSIIPDTSWGKCERIFGAVAGCLTPSLTGSTNGVAFG